MKDSNDIKETDAIGNHMRTLLKDDMPFGMRTLLKDYIPFGRLKCLSYNEAFKLKEICRRGQGTYPIPQHL